MSWIIMNMSLVDSIGFYDFLDAKSGMGSGITRASKNHSSPGIRWASQEMDSVQTLRRGVLIGDTSDPNGAKLL